MSRETYPKEELESYRKVQALAYEAVESVRKELYPGIRASGYVNCHSIYPQRVSGHSPLWEEILVVTDSTAYWLDEDLPHVRLWKENKTFKSGAKKQKEKVPA